MRLKELAGDGGDAPSEPAEEARPTKRKKKSAEKEAAAAPPVVVRQPEAVSNLTVFLPRFQKGRHSCSSPAKLVAPGPLERRSAEAFAIPIPSQAQASPPKKSLKDKRKERKALVRQNGCYSIK